MSPGLVSWRVLVEQWRTWRWIRFFLCEELEPRFSWSWSYSAFQHVIIWTAKKTGCYWKVEIFDLFKDSCNTHLQILLKYLVAKMPKGWITKRLIRNLIDKERKIKYLGAHSCLKLTLMSPWVLRILEFFYDLRCPASCAGCAPMPLH